MQLLTVTLIFDPFDTPKPKAYTIGQTPQRLFKPVPAVGDKPQLVTGSTPRSNGAPNI